jgi:hypothetical protein
MSRNQGSRRRSIAARLFALLSIVGFAMAAHSSAAASTSTGRWFWVLRNGGLDQVFCNELARGRNAVLYASRDALLSPTDASSLVTAFDTHILPTDTRLFGLPNKMGPVVILLAPLGTATLGYFDENDLLKSGSRGSDSAHSNHGNVLYVGPQSNVVGAARLAAIDEVIAHELQHLIEYRIRVMDHRFSPEELWLNEGMSFYAQVANGYWTQNDVLKVQAAAQMPGWPVVSLGESTEYLRRHARTAYGRAGLFVSYLAARFGDSFVRSVVSSRLTGMPAIQDALRTALPKVTLSQVFADWGVGTYLNRRGVYGYGSLPAYLVPAPTWLVPEVETYPYDSQRTAGGLRLTPWGQGYVRFTITRAADLRVSVSGPAARILVAAILQDSTGAVGTSVRWMTFQTDGRGELVVRGFGGFYNRLTIVMSDAGTPGWTSTASDSVRVRANLVHVRDDD